jgi:hypothetical protein
MSMVPRCHECDELVTRCVCPASPKHPGYTGPTLTEREAAAQDAYAKRFKERGWL